jgi:hypothetical protein
MRNGSVGERGLAIRGALPQRQQPERKIVLKIVSFVFITMRIPCSRKQDKVECVRQLRENLKRGHDDKDAEVQ